MQAFLETAKSDGAVTKKRRRQPAAATATIYGRFVAAARTARNIKFTIAPFATQPGVGAKSSTANAYRDGDILFLSDGEEFAPVINLAEEPFSATQFVRGEYDIALTYGDVVKMRGVHMKRSGDRTYYNCSLVEKWATLPNWDCTCPFIPMVTTDLPTDPDWSVGVIKMTKFNKPYARLDCGETKIMLWKEHIDRVIELTQGFVVPDYKTLNLKELLDQVSITYWVHGEGNVVSIAKSDNTPVGFDMAEMVSKVVEERDGLARAGHRSPRAYRADERDGLEGQGPPWDPHLTGDCIGHK